MRIRVVPVSTIPAEFGRMVVDPYVMVWLIPQKKLEGGVVVRGLSNA